MVVILANFINDGMREYEKAECLEGWIECLQKDISKLSGQYASIEHRKNQWISDLEADLEGKERCLIVHPPIQFKVIEIVLPEYVDGYVDRLREIYCKLHYQKDAMYVAMHTMLMEKDEEIHNLMQKRALATE